MDKSRDLLKDVFCYQKGICEHKTRLHGIIREPPAKFKRGNTSLDNDERLELLLTLTLLTFTK